MPPAARLNDPTQHGKPLSPGIGSPDVLIGNQPAWRALPAGMGAGIESASNALKQLMETPVLRPPQTPDKMAQALSGFGQDAGAAAGNGAAGAPGAVSSAGSAMTTANVSLTAAYTSASAAPGAEPAAAQAYTQGIKAAIGAAASAIMSAIGGVTDVHICPTPYPPPHGPGVVTKGSA
ncbi:MAG: hypothetical protein HRF43_01145, partial [Phycisphaerae bacterium]